MVMITFSTSRVVAEKVSWALARSAFEAPTRSPSCSNQTRTRQFERQVASASSMSKGNLDRSAPYRSFQPRVSSPYRSAHSSPFPGRPKPGPRHPSASRQRQSPCHVAQMAPSSSAPLEVLILDSNQETPSDRFATSTTPREARAREQFDARVHRRRHQRGCASRRAHPHRPVDESPRGVALSPLVSPDPCAALALAPRPHLPQLEVKCLAPETSPRLFDDLARLTSSWTPRSGRPGTIRNTTPHAARSRVRRSTCARRGRTRRTTAATHRRPPAGSNHKIFAPRCPPTRTRGRHRPRLDFSRETASSRPRIRPWRRSRASSP